MSLAVALSNAVRLAQAMRPFWGRVGQHAALGILAGLIALALPQLARLLFDRVLPARDWNLLLLLVLATAAATAGLALVNGLRSYLAQTVTGLINSQLVAAFSAHLLRLPASFWDSHSVGEVLARTTDLQRAANFVGTAMQTLIVRGVYLLVVPPLLLLMNWRLSLLAIAAVPLTAGLSLVAGHRVRALTQRAIEDGAHAGAVQTEAFHHVRLIKSVAAEAEVSARYADAAASAQAAQLRAARTSVALTIVNGVLTAAVGGAYTYYAWQLILRGQLSLGEFIAFSAYLGYLRGPLGEVAGLFATLQSTSVSLARYFEYLGIDAEPLAEPLAKPLVDVGLPLHQPGGGTPAPAAPTKARPEAAVRHPVGVELSGVTFRYDAAPAILHGATLALPAGRAHAVIGPSGSGKTSLLKLITRVRMPCSGEVRIGGVTVEDFPLLDLRRDVGVVWQEGGVLRDTVRANLCLGTPSATDTALWRALETVCLRADIEALPAGLDSRIAEGGVTLSSGQRQRLAIARLLVRPRPILLFDEATANLDTRTELAVMHNLLTLRTSATLVFVTHRAQVAELVDQVHLLHMGQFVGGAPHAALMREDARYRAHWSSDGAMVPMPASAGSPEFRSRVPLPV